MDRVLFVCFGVLLLVSNTISCGNGRYRGGGQGQQGGAGPTVVVIQPAGTNTGQAQQPAATPGNQGTNSNGGTTFALVDDDNNVDQMLLLRRRRDESSAGEVGEKKGEHAGKSVHLGLGGGIGLASHASKGVSGELHTPVGVRVGAGLSLGGKASTSLKGDGKEAIQAEAAKATDLTGKVKDTVENGVKETGVIGGKLVSHAGTLVRGAGDHIKSALLGDGAAESEAKQTGNIGLGKIVKKEKGSQDGGTVDINLNGLKGVSGSGAQAVKAGSEIGGELQKRVGSSGHLGVAGQNKIVGEAHKRVGAGVSVGLKGAKEGTAAAESEAKQTSYNSLGQSVKKENKIDGNIHGQKGVPIGVDEAVKAGAEIGGGLQKHAESSSHLSVSGNKKLDGDVNKHLDAGVSAGSVNAGTHVKTAEEHVKDAKAGAETTESEGKKSGSGKSVEKEKDVHDRGVIAGNLHGQNGGSAGVDGSVKATAEVGGVQKQAGASAGKHIVGDVHEHLNGGVPAGLKQGVELVGNGIHVAESAGIGASASKGVELGGKGKKGVLSEGAAGGGLSAGLGVKKGVEFGSSSVQGGHAVGEGKGKHTGEGSGAGSGGLGVGLGAGLGVKNEVEVGTSSKYKKGGHAEGEGKAKHTGEGSGAGSGDLEGGASIGLQTSFGLKSAV